MNQDLRAWLDRLNAVPPGEQEQVGPDPTFAQAPKPAPIKQPAVLQPAAPVSPSTTAPSPGVVPTSPATAVTQPDAAKPAVAVAAGTPNGNAALAAPASKANSSTSPGVGSQPASPPFSDAPKVSTNEQQKKAPDVAPGQPAVTTPAPLPPPPKPVWIAENGSSLRYEVTTWAKRANWTVVWDADVDYPIVGTLSYEGDFVEAVAGIFRAHSRSTQPLHVDIYPRQKLIHIPKE